MRCNFQKVRKIFFTTKVGMKCYVFYTQKMLRSSNIALKKCVHVAFSTSQTCFELPQLEITGGQYERQRITLTCSNCWKRDVYARFKCDFWTSDKIWSLKNITLHTNFRRKNIFFEIFEKSSCFWGFPWDWVFKNIEFFFSSEVGMKCYVF